MMDRETFVVFKGKDGHYVRWVAKNKKTRMLSEHYYSKSNALRAAIDASALVPGSRAVIEEPDGKWIVLAR